MILRPYQSDCLDAVATAALDGCNRQLVVLPTAAGKTIVFAQLPTRLRIRRPDQMLVLVQSDEIAFQSVQKLQACNPTLKIGLEKAQYKSTWSDDIVVASVQSLRGSQVNEETGKWEWSKRLLTLDRDRFRYVVIDESHHTTSPTYHPILRYFQIFKSDPKFNDPTRFLLGVTATPNRSDNQGLEAFFERIVFQRDIKTMVKDKWLATPEAHRVNTMVNLDKVAVRARDFATNQLENAVNIPERNKLIVDKYLELGEGAPFLGFTVDIQHTINLTNMFRERGIPCFGIASKSDKDSPWLVTGERERKEIIEGFNRGEFRGLLSCAALLEGFDAPRAMVGLDGAPTRSALRFTQKLGRTLRPYPAPEDAPTWGDKWRKRCAIWIDFVDSCSRHSVMTAPALFGLRPDFDAKGKSVTEAAEEVERIKSARPGVNTDLFTDLDRLRAVAEKVDLFKVPEVAAEVAGYSQFAWTTGMGEGTYQLQIPGDNGGMLSIQVNALGVYEIAKHLNGFKSPLGAAANLQAALRAADKYVPQAAMIVLKSDAQWRQLPPSEKQLNTLKYLYPELRKPFKSDDEFYEMAAKQYSRGSVAALITARSHVMQSWGRR